MSAAPPTTASSLHIAADSSADSYAEILAGRAMHMATSGEEGWPKHTAIRAPQSRDTLRDSDPPSSRNVALIVIVWSRSNASHPGGLRQQKVANIFSSRRQASYLDSHAVTGQMAGDVRTLVLGRDPPRGAHGR